MRVLNCILFVLILGGGCLAVGQGRVIDEATYRERMRRAGELLISQPYRERQVTEGCKFHDCVWCTLMIVVTEVARSGATRALVTDPRSETAASSEWIHLDEKTYVRRGKLEWKVEEVPKRPPATQETEILSVEYHDLGPEVGNGKVATVLLKTTHYRSVFNGETRESAQTVKSWLDNSGRFLKQEFLSKSHPNLTRLTMTYENDPSIKVTAPPFN